MALPVPVPIYFGPDLEQRGACSVADMETYVAAFVDQTPGGNDFVYQQDGPLPLPRGYYGTFAETYAAAVASGVSIPRFVIDDRYGIPEITAGNYPLINGMQFVGNGGFPVLTVRDAAHITVPGAIGTGSFYVVGCTLNVQAKTAPMLSAAVAALTVFMEDGASIVSDPFPGAATKAIFALTGGSILNLNSGFAGTISGIAGAPVLSAGGGRCQVFVSQFSTLTDHSFTGASEIDVSLLDGSVIDSIDTNQPGATNVHWATEAAPSADFGATASLTTAVDQAIPSGSGAATSSADLVLGKVMSRDGLFTMLVARFTGAANLSGQTATIRFQADGVDIPGATTAALATTAGVHTAAVSLATTPFAFPAGTVITSIVKPSAALDVALANVMSSIS